MIDLLILTKQEMAQMYSHMGGYSGKRESLSCGQMIQRQDRAGGRTFKWR